MVGQQRTTAHYERDCPMCGVRIVEERDREYAPMVGAFWHCGQRVDIGRTIYRADGTAIHNP
jgi:hypothetical protein